MPTPNSDKTPEKLVRELHEMRRRVETPARAGSERRRAEDTLRKLTRAVEQSPSIIVITDSEGVIEYVNPKFSEVTGYSAEEVLGRNPRMLRSSDQPVVIFSSLWRQVASDREWRGEFCNRKKDGQTYWEDARISAIKDADGVITHFVKVAEDITARKAAELKLRESEERYRSLQENIPVGIFRATPDGTIVSLNSALAEMLGYESREELLGSPSADTYFIPERRDDYVRLLHSQGTVSGFEVELRRKDGSPLWASLTARAVRDPSGQIVYHDGIIENITERKRAEEEINRRTFELEALREVALEITAELEQDVLLESLVSWAVALLGGTSGALYLRGEGGRAVEDKVSVAVPARPSGVVADMGRRLTAEVLATGEAVVDGGSRASRDEESSGASRHEIPMVGVPVRWKDEFLGVLTVAAAAPRSFSRDDAEVLLLFAAQAAIAIRNARLVQSLRELNDFKDAVMGLAAHDLRGPLTHVAGYLELLGESLGPLNKKQTKWLQTIRDSVSRMTELTGGILHYQRLTAQGELKRDHCDLNQVAAAVKHEHDTAASEKSHVLRLHTGDRPVVVSGDELLLKEALGNLVGNAIKYTPAGGRITIRVGSGAEEAWVEVQDSGPGIGQEDRARLFGPFTRLPTEDTQPGLGLGLSLVKTIVERHGGRVTLESTVGEGSTFGFRLPARPGRRPSDASRSPDT